ncbi:MAG TPA: hypothetical protein VGY56_11050 [Verrucomicrobiae bacterium]|nr:hypothetical protein [Verrucomicrobiae bacterium]
MTASEPKLRETQPPIGNGAVKAAQPRSNPTRLFVEKDRLAWFWFLFAMGVLVFAAIDRFALVESFKQRERIVVVDPANTYYVSPVMRFEDAKELHAQQSELATIAFLERNPEGFDNEDLLKQMFLKSALSKAQTELRSETEEFQAKQLHQKVEIGRIDILNTRENAVLTQVTGQLIRVGIFDGKAFTEAVPFRLTLKLLRNPNMLLNGRFPTAVSDFKYEILD